MRHSEKVTKMSLQNVRDSVILSVKDGKAVCPVCGGVTPVTILPTTRLEDFPLFCKRCRQITKVKYRRPELKCQS